MKRKTNLFYTTGPDSKFITFSNYTESLTGNFLSTDTKIFPSRFIALYLKGLNKETKPALIKYIANYYESKLAVLRDYFNYNKSDIEKSVPPLNYLLEALLRIREIKEDGVIADHSISNQLKAEGSNEYDKILSYTDVVKFKYISDITEQDYNGTFADTICNIDLRKFAYISSVELTEDFNDNVAQFDMPETLYGWDGEIPEEYANEHTIPDSVQGIDLDLYVSSITMEEPTNGTINNPGRGIDLPEYDHNKNLENRIIYNINSELPNTISITDKIIDFTDENNESHEVTLIELINAVMEEKGYDSYADAISEILHMTTPAAMALKTLLDDILANSENDYTLFYDNTNPDVIFVYDGADVFELDMTKNNEYNIDPEIIKLNIALSNDDSIEFNCIIPLYDIVDINYKSNFNTIERIISTNGTGTIDLKPSSTNKLYCENVPLGMWLYSDGDVNDENTTSMKLYKDIESGFSQSWSLTISSQFKPFPYSSKMPSELTTNSNTNAYATFAQVLASQAAMIDNFNKLTATIANMNDHIRNMESQLANLGTSYNIDNIHREFNNFEINMNNKFSALKDNVIEQLSYLKWRTTI